MRKKLIIAGATGALALGGLAVGVPALADDSAPSTGTPGAASHIRDALADLVADGSLTAEQADEVATALSNAGPDGPGPHGRGLHLGLAAAAEALDMTEEALRTALEADDASLATTAEAQGVPVEDLVSALTTAAEEHVARAVEVGDLTQAEADERLADLEQRITERVHSTDLGDVHGGGHGSGGGPRHGHGFSPAPGD